MPCIYKCRILVWFSELFPEAGVRRVFLVTVFFISNLQASACLHGTQLASNLNCTLLQLHQRSSCSTRCLCSSCGLVLHGVRNVCKDASSRDPASESQGFVSSFPPNYINGTAALLKVWFGKGLLNTYSPTDSQAVYGDSRCSCAIRATEQSRTLTRLLPPSLTLRGFCLAWNNLAVLSWLWRGS